MRFGGNGCDGARRGEQVLDQAPMKRFQAAALGRSQVVGQAERAQIGQQALEILDASFQLDGPWTHPRRGFRSQRGGGVREEIPAVGPIRHAKGRHENRRVGWTQLVCLNGQKQAVLIGGWHRGQRRGQRGADAATRELVLSLSREAGGELQTGGDPARLVTQEVSRRFHRPVVVIDQRLHDERLIHGGERPGGRVGHEQQALVVCGTCRRLDDDGHPRVTGFTPAEEPLEPIDNFVDVLAARDHAQREVSQGKRTRRERSSSQGFVAGPDLFDGQEPNGAGHVLPGSETSGQRGRCHLARGCVTHGTSPIRSRTGPYPRRPRHATDSDPDVVGSPRSGAGACSSRVRGRP